MSREEHDTYVKGRIQRAEEALAFAKICYDLGNYNMTVNRLYYAIFYAALALLAQKESYPKTHSGAKSELGRYFVKSGMLSVEDGKLYAQLHDMRQVGDYGDLKSHTKEDVMDLIPHTKDLVTKMANLVRH